MRGWRLVLVVVLAAAVACGGDDGDADAFCAATEAFLVDGEVPSTTVLAPEPIRQDLDFIATQSFPFGAGVDQEAMDEAEQRFAAYLVEECGIDRDVVDALDEDADDGFFN